MKSSDIQDSEILDIVQQIGSEGRRTLVWDLQNLLPYPSKVILAKCRRLINSGKMKGCSCGCRGDFEIVLDGKIT